MPPMPPMPESPGKKAGLSSLMSVIMHSDVIMSDATDAASVSAVRTTLSGSSTPALTMSVYSSVAAL